MRQSIGIIASVLGVMGGFVYLILSMDNYYGSSGATVSCIIISLSVLLFFISVYSAKSREMMEKNNGLLEHMLTALKHDSSRADRKAKASGEENSEGEGNEPTKQDLQKYKEMFEKGQITKEEYMKYLDGQSSKLA